MSSVDNRIVEMQFNNRRFEENARETMSTLDKLKEKLNFRDSTKELENFQNAADTFNLTRIANAVDEIGNKFSLMGQLGYQAMQRIASSALDAGAALVKSISVDQISAGMQKYEQETNVIQTLYGALKPKGTKLDEIYDVMETLTAYSDETSYSYTQMADAVSKFVNAGVDLHKAETVIEGISNAAALAGIGIHDTEIIYRNFADAIGKGGFRAQDWKSIKIAHMDTEWLKEAFIQEAIAQGKLDKSGRVQTKAEKRNKKGEITQAAEYKNVRDDFESTLVKGWLDNDVINGVMLKYATRDMEGFGKEAFAAAQNAKTFTDVIDAVKDSVSTGWSRSFRIIFGDLEEAIAFFTPMANKVIEFTAAIDEARNAMLGQWKDLGGRDSMIGTLEKLWGGFNKLSDAFSGGFVKAFYESFYPTWKDMEESATSGGINNLMGEQFYKLTKRIEDAAQAFNDWLNGKTTENGLRRIQLIENVFKGIFSAVNIVRQAISGVFTFVSEIFKQLQPSFDAVMQFLSEIGLDIGVLNKDLSKNNGFSALAKSLSAMFEPLTSRLPKAVNWLRDMYNRLKKMWSSNARFVAFRKSIEKVFGSFIKFVPQAIESLIGFGKGIIETVKNSDEWKALVQNYNKYVKPVVGKIEALAIKFNEALSEFFSMDTSSEGTLWEKLKKRFSVFDKLGPWLQQSWNELKKQIPWLQDVEDWWTTDPIVQEIKAWVGEIAHAVDVFLSEDTSGNTSIVGKIKQRFEAMWNELGPWIEGKWSEYKEKYPFLQQMEDFLKPLFGWGKEADDSANEGIEETEKTVGFLEQLWGKITEFVDKIDFGKLAMFGVAIGVLVKVYQMARSLFGWASLGENLADAVEEIGSFIKQARKTMKKSNMMANITAILEVAASIWLLGDTLTKVAQLSWEEIAKGLVAMGGLFVEEGAFMVLMGKLNTGKGKAKPMQMIGLAASMYILGLTLKNVASLTWDEIGRGLSAMGGLFVEEGAFMVIVNKFGSTGLFKKKGTSATSMIALAGSMYILGLTLKNVASLTWDEIGRGLTTMGGLFAETGAFMILVNRFGSPSIFKSKGASATSMIALANSMKKLADVLKQLSEMTWEEIGRGLGTMGALFAEQGAFIILVNRLGSRGPLSGGGTSLSSTLGTTTSIMLLANKLKDLASMSWEEIGRGLAAMAGLFVEEGAFMAIIGFLSKKNAIDPNAVNATTGILAGGIGMMGDAMAKLGQLSWDEILHGAAALGAIEVILGLFVGLMGKFKTVKITSAIGMAAVAGSIWILVQAFMPLTGISWDQYAVGIAALGSVMVVLGLFCGVMSQMKMSIKTTLGVIISAIALAALMVAFAFALTLIKDVDVGQILAFGAAMVLVSGAMAVLAATLNVFGKMDLGAAVKGTAIMVIAAAGLAAAVALILTIVGQSIQDFSNNIAVVGANLAQYSEQVEGINMEAVNNSVTMIKDLSATFVEVGTKDYGNLDTFRTSLARMGASLKLFGLNTVDLDTEKMKTTTAALKQMATDLSGLSEVSDVSTTIGNIGGAIKLYSESLNGVDLSTAPDATAIQTVFNSLKGALPSDEDMTTVAGYAAEGKGDEMTNFAIGLTNIATAVSSFSESAKDLDFTNIEKATNALTAISSLNSGLSVDAIVNFGPFSVELHTQQQSLTDLATDIVNLSTALQAFGTNISAVDTEQLTAGVTVLGKIVDLNNALPKTGGISSWITGQQSLSNFAAQLRLLGGGASAFSESIAGTTFDANSVGAAGDALIKIAEVNSKLPKTGGISSWFTGDESLGNFSSGLKELGKGVKEFAESFGDTKIDKDISDGVGLINRIAGIQVKLGNANSWYSMDSLGRELNTAAGQFVELNNKLVGVTTWADLSGFESLLTFAVDQQVKLGSTQYSKNLKDIGVQVKDFFNEIWNFTATWTGADSGKLDKVTSSVVSIFTTLNDTFTNAESQESFTATGESILTFLMNGFKDENSKIKVQNAVNDICGAIITKVKSYTGKGQAFYNVGTWIPAGLGDGIWGNRYAAINAAVDVMNAAITAAEKAGGIASPSKEFARLGMYSDMGFAQGLMGSIYLVDTAAGQVSQSALDTVLSDMQAIQDLPLDQLEINPTIRPVLDTSAVASRAGMIDGLLGGTRSIGFNTRQLEAQAQLLGDSTGADINSVNQQIMALRDQLAQLEETMTNIKMVVDTGALVGAMRTDIDKAMGAMARRGERGN